MICKRFLWLLAIVLLVGAGTSAFAAGFPDTVSTPYQETFAYLSEKGIVRGYSDGFAHPEGYLNRAEALKVIMVSQPKYAERVIWHKNNMPPLPLFGDMRQDQWFAPFVEAAFEAEVLQGYPDATLRPSQVLRVEEAVVLLMRAYGEAGDVQTAELSTAIQNTPGQWYTPAINASITRNLVRKDQPILRLGDPITRGQFFDMVFRMMRVKETGTLAYRDSAVSSQPVATAQGSFTNQHAINVPQQPLAVVSQPQPVVSSATLTYASEKYFSISMPSLGIKDLTVTHPTDPFSQQGVLEPLRLGVGHLFSYPGGGGKIMIYGHSSGYPWDISEFTKIFRKVNQLKPGDKIYVTYEGKLHTYEVTHEQTIAAKDSSPFSDNGAGEELILYTCWPPDSIAQRYLVHARAIDTVALQ
ncbi:hypothetical protein COU78_04680 [Candidatus Peregrinibacteria bacterium CG10_big_fil_rev_8_21_14_0_10_49_24]|nr:MAG: hypothetical protein COV83_03825 [Candidatus Peregrinibacteria bacterium CG11_big_fil_rev_8_21_14_0_20_49_14]PIR50647.1 MAG: hypothetical protein COU78_04680 [Candidatus Peregrinibacteria bacterium CG10_big_fil_rev_8_21_14_0_10_49_24]PJA67731.1 MAG: hypothetical protein CO157_02970 [Candidatus Peregrinibacteria bacterium CG_4_9_14_3_um_filter_49_12]